VKSSILEWKKMLVLDLRFLVDDAMTGVGFSYLFVTSSPIR